jgi:hypothetical protein
MGKIYKGQSALRITVKTFIELVDVLSAVIRFRKPDGSTGEFAAGAGDAGRGIIFHECIEGEIDASGWWAFWAFITFADGRTAAGETAKVYVWHEGSG